MNPNFIEADLPSAITEWAIPLASNSGDFWWASGTAVIVAPFLAITAKHVIDDHWHRQQGAPPASEGAHGEFSLVAFQVSEKRGTMPMGGSPDLAFTSHRYRLLEAHSVE